MSVAIVTFDSPDLARSYSLADELKWPILIDRQRRLYRSYGMGEASWWDTFGPTNAWKHLRLMLGGTKLGRFGEDFRQLGGDVLIDPHGIVRVHYVSSEPHDRPTVESIKAKLS